MRELLVDSCRAAGEDGQSRGYRYYILVGEMEVSGGLACESYGVKVVSEDSGEWAEVPDLTIRPARIDALMDLLVRNAVSPVTLRDVIDDWL